MNALSLDDSAPTLIHTRTRVVVPISLARTLPPPDETQPAHRLRRENTAYRKIATVLVIALAFATGTSVAFGVQLATASGPTNARQARVAITRSASFHLVSGAPAKVEVREPEAPRPTRRARAGKPPAAPAPATPATEEPAAEVSARDLLGKGITAD